MKYFSTQFLLGFFACFAWLSIMLLHKYTLRCIIIQKNSWGVYMNSKVEYANECFEKGFNCSQAVLTAFCEDYGLDKNIALKMGCSFGAGMGYMGEACGAVTGAFLVLGLINGQNVEGDTYSRALTYLFVKDFASRFRKINGTINCKELLNYDLSDEVQLNAARQTDIFKTKCPKYVRDAVLILEEMIDEQNPDKTLK